MKIVLIWPLLLLSNIFGSYIIHERINEAPYNLPCKIEAFLNISEDNIHSFSLLYRPTGSVGYLETPMIFMGQFKYWAEIPGNFIGRYIYPS